MEVIEDTRHIQCYDNEEYVNQAVIYLTEFHKKSLACEP